MTRAHLALIVVGLVGLAIGATGWLRQPVALVTHDASDGHAPFVKRRTTRDENGRSLWYTTRFYLVLVSSSWALVGCDRGLTAASALLRWFLPVFRVGARFRWCSYSQRLQVTDPSWWCTGPCRGTLAGIAILAFAF